MSTSRTLVLENLPPVVRITFENGVITLTAQNPDPSTLVSPPENPPSDGKSEPSSFQITSPGRYRLRNDEEVDLLPLPSDHLHYEDGFRWYGIIPSESQEDWTTANSDPYDCDTWTPNGSWWGKNDLSNTDDQDDWDVVSGPLVVSSPSDSSPAPSESEEDDYPGPVPCVPPVVGHRFKMRNGKTTIVTRRDNDDWYPFDSFDARKEPWKSLRIESDESLALCWTPGGHHDLDVAQKPYVSEYDLVEDLGSVIPRVPESTSSSAQEPFQIKEPGWYRFRNGTLVELRARTPNDDDRVWNRGYSWFAVNPARDLSDSCQPVQTQGYDLANVLRHPWWRTDGSYLALASPSNLWCDVVSGPFPAPSVRTFPSWLHPNYDFVARDEDGTWYAYGKRPVKAEDRWDPSDDDQLVRRLWTDQVAEEQRPSIVPDVPWYDSLIERPNVTS